MLVIDGQQRLKSLLFFYEGYFNPKPEEKRRRVFSLVKVQAPFAGKTYSDLDERDRIRLGNSVIHATIVKQTAPPGDDASVYHIFERLNSGGRRLTPQEIRVALYHGALIDTVRWLNDHESWRRIFGKPNPRLKDQELILRFLALYMEPDRYMRPMAEFVNRFTGRNRNPSREYLSDAISTFQACANLFWKAVGKAAFRPTRAINAAVFDSCMVGLAHRLQKPPLPAPETVRKVYEGLLRDGRFQEVTLRIDGIISNRHLIAHGRDAGVTVARVKTYLEKCVEVVEFLETQCGM